MGPIMFYSYVQDAVTVTFLSLSLQPPSQHFGCAARAHFEPYMVINASG